MSRALDGLHQLPLVLCARAGNALGDDFPLFIDEPLQSLFVFVVNIRLFCIAESTGAFLSRALSLFFASWFSYWSRGSHCSSPSCMIDVTGGSLVVLTRSGRSSLRIAALDPMALQPVLRPEGSPGAPGVQRELSCPAEWSDSAG